MMLNIRRVLWMIDLVAMMIAWYIEKTVGITPRILSDFLSVDTFVFVILTFIFVRLASENK